MNIKKDDSLKKARKSIEKVEALANDVGLNLDSPALTAASELEGLPVELPETIFSEPVNEAPLYVDPVKPVRDVDSRIMHLDSTDYEPRSSSKVYKNQFKEVVAYPESAPRDSTLNPHSHPIDFRGVGIAVCASAILNLLLIGFIVVLSVAH